MECASRWAAQYANYAGDEAYSVHREIGRKLASLDPETVSAEQVNAIIGNDGWTTLKCNECNASVKTVLEVGEPRDYESRTVRLCAWCVAIVVTQSSSLSPQS